MDNTITIIASMLAGISLTLIVIGIFYNRIIRWCIEEKEVYIPNHDPYPKREKVSDDILKKKDNQQKKKPDFPSQSSN